MADYDTFVIENAGAIKEGQELVTVLRDLTPGKKKYKSAYGRIKISLDPDKYPHSLSIRTGQGKLVDKRYSMEIVSWEKVIPEGW